MPGYQLSETNHHEKATPFHRSGGAAPGWTNRSTRIGTRRLSEPTAFWSERGRSIDWFKPFTKVKNTSFGPGEVFIRWFEDGATNVAYMTGTSIPEVTESLSSGRRILRKIAENEFGNLGDKSTLADPAVVDDLILSRQNLSGKGGENEVNSSWPPGLRQRHPGRALDGSVWHSAAIYWRDASRSRCRQNADWQPR